MPAARPIRTFTVLPQLPPRLQALHKLAYNMWWCWNHEAAALFRRIDPDAFEGLDHSPVKMLGFVDQARLGSAGLPPMLVPPNIRIAPVSWSNRN